MNVAASTIQAINCFHCGLFAASYIVIAFAIYIYHRGIASARALWLITIGSAIAHICSFLIEVLGPTNFTLHLGLTAYCTWAAPSIMLVIKDAVTPRWLTLKRFAKYLSVFMIGTVACLITSNVYILYILLALDIFATVWGTFVLWKSIDQREKLVKEYFTDIEEFGHGWVKNFMYYQILSSIFFAVLCNFREYTILIIIWNYIQLGYWLFYILKCREQKYYSTVIPEDIKECFNEIDKQQDAIIMGDKKPEIQQETNTEKSILSDEMREYIERRLKEIETDKFYLNDSFNLASLAQHVGTNRTYMSMYFRLTETTFWDYVNEKRCLYAIDIMKQNPDITMAELAGMAGYKTENCFRTSFSTIYGKTPFVYKRTLRGK